MYYLTTTHGLGSLYFLYKVQGEIITRTSHIRGVLKVTLQSTPVVEVDTHPLKNSKITVLAKFDTKPTYAMIREQYPELLL